MTRIFTLLLAVIVLAYSCKTASKSYQKGDYTEAIDRGIKKLQKDPDDYETKELVKNSYTYTVNELRASSFKRSCKIKRIMFNCKSLDYLLASFHLTARSPKLVANLSSKYLSQNCDTQGI